MRDLLFLAVLVASSVLIVSGVVLWSVPAALILAGLLLAGVGWLVLGGPDGSNEVVE